MDAPRIAPLMSAVERIKTSSVLAPLLALDVITGAVALLASIMIAAPLLYWIWGCFGFCVAATIVAYLAFSIREPNRLQTEHYQLAQQRLLLIGDERDPNSMKLVESIQSANNAAGAA